MGQQVAIVTGGGYGIGRAVTTMLAEIGWKVVIFDADREKGAETENLILEKNGEGFLYVGDVTCSQDIQHCVDLTLRKYQRIDALVNNAGLKIPGSIMDITEDQWDQSMAVNLKGMFLFSQKVIPSMIQNGGGSIVNISSPDSYGRGGSIAYSTSKAGVNTFTKSLAMDVLEYKIRVNCVVPGFILTGMTEHYSDERLKKLAEQSVAGRVGQPRDVAALVKFLVSEDSEAYTGGTYDMHHIIRW